MTNSFLKKLSAYLLVFALAFMYFPIMPAYAANVTGISDTASTLTQNTAANHEIDFTTPSGVPADGSTFTITFDGGFNLGSVGEDDIDVEDDNTDLTTAATCGSVEAAVTVASQTITVEICSAGGGAIAASSEITVEIGDNATASGTGSNQITNPNDTNTHVNTIAGSFGDIGQWAMDFVADDSVNITATVDPSITFSISDTAIGFGDLDAGSARWANAAATGSGTDISAHNIQVGTNATDGYVVTYYGATLTSSGDTIDVASISNDANGTPGTEQFAMSFAASGDATIAAGYSHGDPDWTFVASTTTTIVSETGPTATETISAYYIANIAANTEAGAYSTDVTYIATATF